MADKFLDVLLNGMKRLASFLGDMWKRCKKTAPSESETYTD